MTDDARWRFKKADGLVYGPVPTSVVAEQIARDELDGDAPVAPEDGAFRPLREVSAFQADLLRAEARRKVQVEAAQARARARRRRFALAALWAAAGLAAAIAVSEVAVWLAGASGALRAPEDPGMVGVTVGPPQVRSFARRVPDPSELIAYDALAGAGSTPGQASGRPAPAPPWADKAPPAPLASVRPGPAPTPAPAPAPVPRRPAQDDPDGLALAPRYDQNHINEVVKKNQASLFPCIAEEKRRSPEFRGSIPIEFTIQNDGRVGKLWIDVARFREGPLYDCLMQKLSEWRFDRYSGEQANVSFAFRVN